MLGLGFDVVNLEILRFDVEVLMLDADILRFDASTQWTWGLLMGYSLKMGGGILFFNN